MRLSTLSFNHKATAVVAAMIAAAIGARILAPTHVVESVPFLLNSVIPTKFATWSAVDDGPQQVSLFATDENGQNPMNEVYDDSLLRSYVDIAGNRVMVAIAYDHVQREEDRVHRPEICYIAQGFSILSDTPFTFNFPGSFPAIQGRRMLARHGSRLEAVSYWIRTGDSFTENPWRSRSYVISEGLAGRLHDGILVRTSEIIRSPLDALSSFTRQQVFLNSLLTSVDVKTEVLLARGKSNERSE